MDVLTLIDKRQSLWREMDTFLDEHTDKDGKISAEDAAAYDKMEAEIIALDKNIKRYSDRAARDSEMAKPTSQPILNNPKTDAAKTGRASDAYRKAALNALRSNFQQVDNLMQESVAADGGYLVPEEWDSRLVEILREANVMRRLADIVPTSSTHKILIQTTKSIAYWVAEGAPIPQSNMTFTQKMLDAHKMAAHTTVTNELLADNAYNLESKIIEDFGKTLGEQEEDAFINGDGNGKPTGLLTTAMADSDCVLMTAGASISADDIINLVYKLKRPYRAKGAFLMNDATLAAIRKLKDSTQQFLWQQSYQEGEPEKLLGYPVYTSAFFPTAESGKAAIAFGDFQRGYTIGDRGTRWFKRLEEKYADIFSTGFVMVERVDGILVDNAAVKVLKVK